MPTCLLKTEPSEFSFADLVAARRTIWSGVSNPAALIAIRSMRKGDEAFIYHTGSEKAIVGLARVLRDPFEDPERPGRNDRGEPRFAVVEIAPLRPAKSPATLAQLKADPRFAGFTLITHPRLSVMPVAPTIDRTLRALIKV